MADKEQDLDEAEYERIRAQVEAEADEILVPFDLIGDYERPPGAATPESLFSKILTMAVSEKVKLALRGNKDARTILLRDASKMIRRFVLQNPRIGDSEVIAICRNRSADDELLRIISARREWMKNYQVRLALATNPKTPLPVAMRQVFTLGERDLQQLAKSRNVPQAVATQARRIVVEKREKK